MIINLFHRLKFNIIYVIGSWLTPRGRHIPDGAISSHSKAPTPSPLSHNARKGPQDAPGKAKWAGVVSGAGGAEMGRISGVVWMGGGFGGKSDMLALDLEHCRGSITQKHGGRGIGRFEGMGIISTL